jgi:hypothetical protein
LLKKSKNVAESMIQQRMSTLVVSDQRTEMICDAPSRHRRQLLVVKDGFPGMSESCFRTAASLARKAQKLKLNIYQGTQFFHGWAARVQQADS